MGENLERQEAEGGREHPTPILPSKEERKKSTIDFSAWQLAWELGYAIAIPIVALALVGRWADKALGTSPWLLLTGILVSIIISSFAVYKKVSSIIN